MVPADSQPLSYCTSEEALQQIPLLCKRDLGWQAVWPPAAALGSRWTDWECESEEKSRLSGGAAVNILSSCRIDRLASKICPHVGITCTCFLLLGYLLGRERTVWSGVWTKCEIDWEETRRLDGCS